MIRLGDHPEFFLRVGLSLVLTWWHRFVCGYPPFSLVRPAPSSLRLPPHHQVSVVLVYVGGDSYGVYNNQSGVGSGVGIRCI